jgi:hypothetical protein
MPMKVIKLLHISKENFNEERFVCFLPEGNTALGQYNGLQMN